MREASIVIYGAVCATNHLSFEFLSQFPMISEGIHVLRLTSWFHRVTWNYFTALLRSPYLQTLMEEKFVRKLRRQVNVVKNLTMLILKTYNKPSFRKSNTLKLLRSICGVNVLDY